MRVQFSQIAVEHGQIYALDSKGNVWFLHTRNDTEQWRMIEPPDDGQPLSEWIDANLGPFNPCVSCGGHGHINGGGRELSCPWCGGTGRGKR